MSMSRELTSLKKSSDDCLKMAKQWYSIWMKWCYFWTTALFSGSAEALVRCGEKLQHLLIAYFLGNMFTKHHEKPTMLSRVTAKNVVDFLYPVYVTVGRYNEYQWAVTRGHLSVTMATVSGCCSTRIAGVNQKCANCNWVHIQEKDPIEFLPRCMQCRRGIVMRILSVRLSVCPSVTRVHCDKTVERSVQIYIPYEITCISLFWEEEWLVGGDPLYLKFWVNRPLMERNRRFSTNNRS